MTKLNFSGIGRELNNLWTVSAVVSLSLIIKSFKNVKIPLGILHVFVMSIYRVCFVFVIDAHIAQITVYLIFGLDKLPLYSILSFLSSLGYLLTRSFFFTHILTLYLLIILHLLNLISNLWLVFNGESKIGKQIRISSHKVVWCV